MIWSTVKFLASPGLDRAHLRLLFILVVRRLHQATRLLLVSRTPAR